MLHVGNGDAISQCISCGLVFIKRHITLLLQKQRRRLGEGSVTLLIVGGKMPIGHAEWVLLSLMISDIRLHLNRVYRILRTLALSFFPSLMSVMAGNIP